MIGFILTLVWIGWIDRKRFLNTPGWNRGLLKPS